MVILVWPRFYRNSWTTHVMVCHCQGRQSCTSTCPFHHESIGIPRTCSTFKSYYHSTIRLMLESFLFLSLELVRVFCHIIKTNAFPIPDPLPVEMGLLQCLSYSFGIRYWASLLALNICPRAKAGCVNLLKICKQNDPPCA